MRDKSKQFCSLKLLIYLICPQGRKEYIMAKRTMVRDWEKKVITILGKEYDYSKLSPEMKDLAGFLGTGTKLVDKLAGMKAYTDQEKSAVVDKTWNNLMEGKWRQPGEGVVTMKKKLTEAKSKATPAELEVLKKLGLA